MCFCCLELTSEAQNLNLRIEEFLLEDIKLNPENVWLRFWKGDDSVILGKQKKIEATMLKTRKLGQNKYAE